MCSCLRHEAVTAEVESVSQSIGRPISVATKNGLRSTFGDPSAPPVVVATERRPGELRRMSPACPASVSPWLLPWLGACLPVRFSFIDARGVAHEPEAFALVGGANGRRGEQTPLRIEPEVGKIGEDVREPESNKLGDVLQQDESRSHVTDDPCDVRPEPPVIVSSTLPACDRERLAGEAGSDEIHSATPRATVEGDEVIPDRSLIQPRLAHPFHEDGRCVGIPLNVSHGSYPCQGSEGELESSVAGAEMEGT